MPGLLDGQLEFFTNTSNYAIAGLTPPLSHAFGWTCGRKSAQLATLRGEKNSYLRSSLLGFQRRGNQVTLVSTPARGFMR